MSLPHLPRDRYVLNMRTFPEGDLQVNFGWHADACGLLLEQASLYGGRVTTFRASIAEHTAAGGRRIMHELLWKAGADERGLYEFVRESVRADLIRHLLEAAEEQLRTHTGTTSPVVRAEWGWDFGSYGPRIDDVPAYVRLADGTEFDDPYDVMDMDVLSYRVLLADLLGLSTDEDLVVYREPNGAIVTNADPDFVAAPPSGAAA
ncbi:hypothetical protein AB0331_13945 [Dietzia maris]|uniref:hypothetical protein n=1 Tax=Dietzia maris TaxID=37915 RepID=UPI0034503039